MIDEVKDMLIKLQSLRLTENEKIQYEKRGNELIYNLENTEMISHEAIALCNSLKMFLSEIDSIYVDDILKHTFSQITLKQEGAVVCR